MKVLDTKFMQGFIKMADDGFHLGWHERNGGNLSYRMTTHEVESVAERLSDHAPWTVGMGRVWAGSISW